MRAWALLVLLACSLACSDEHREVPGDRSAEPLGLHAIAVAHEDLAIDLRPLRGWEWIPASDPSAREALACPEKIARWAR